MAVELFGCCGREFQLGRYGRGNIAEHVNENFWRAVLRRAALLYQLGANSGAMTIRSALVYLDSMYGCLKNLAGIQPCSSITSSANLRQPVGPLLHFNGSKSHGLSKALPTLKKSLKT